MKWYSIKKYIPPTCAETLIRAIHDDDYERYFIASLEIYDDRDLLINWDMANGAIHDIDFSTYKVTHFAVIDPVQIED